LNEELAEKRRLVPIDQILEGRGAGIDAGMYSKHQLFWSWFGIRRKGVRIWDVMKEIIDDPGAPRFKLNLFVQHKRPEYIRSHRAKEYRGWNRPYSRYDITDREQQKALCRLERRANSKALVVYAAAAFWKSSQLWYHYRRGTLVKNSNFVEPLKLQRHIRYTYAAAGTLGYAFSEKAEPIQSIDLLKEIDRRTSIRREFERNSDFIYSLSSVIKEVLGESSAEFQESHRSIVERRMKMERGFGEALETVLAFVIVTDIRWSIVLRTPES